MSNDSRIGDCATGFFCPALQAAQSEAAAPSFIAGSMADDSDRPLGGLWPRNKSRLRSSSGPGRMPWQRREQKGYLGMQS
eukprot:scaffold11677_cov24-Prasinocladus_malaysianus.AAC.1